MPAKPGLKARLMLNLAAVADVEGLEEEVAVLRASIRELAKIEDVAEHVKVLAELRHQIEALCTTLLDQASLKLERLYVADTAETTDFETSNQSASTSHASSFRLRWDMNSSATAPSISRWS